MRRLTGLVALLVIGTALPVFAQTATDVADELDLRGYHIGVGADVTIDEMEELVDSYPGFGFVALDATPDGGADLYANRVLESTSEIDTVVVLTRDEAGAASAVWDDDALDRAFDEAFATTGDTYLTDFRQVAAALGGESSTPGGETPGSGGEPQPSGGGFSVVWIIALAFIGYVGFRLWANSRDDEKAAGRRLGEARREIEAQVAVVANQILELSDRPDLASNAEATAHFRNASEVFRAAEVRLAEATTTQDLERLADDLDDARWELAAAAARLAGEEPPPRPEEAHPEPCFFDPTHGAGVEEATLQTAAGTRTVKVCAADAERLRRGEHPEPRTVSVDGRAVPAPKAPRSHGGGGMDALDVFSILVGGMGDAARYRWGRRRPPMGGGGFGGFGGGFGGGGGSRSRGTASAVRSVSRAIGRARRGR